MNINLVVDGKPVKSFEASFAIKKVFRIRKSLKTKDDVQSALIKFIRQFRGVDVEEV